MTETTLPACPDCGVNAGTAHTDGCDIARCLATGGQRLSCELDAAEGYGPDHDGDCGTDTWTGKWPGVAECEEYGWYALDRCSEGLGFVRCAPGTPGARPDLNRLAEDAVWDRAAGRWRKREDVTDGILIKAFDIARGCRATDTGEPWVELVPTDERTVTLVGQSPHGELRVTAKADGADAEAAAGWWAFLRFFAAGPGVTSEEWERDTDGTWAMTGVGGTAWLVR